MTAVINANRTKLHRDAVSEVKWQLFFLMRWKWRSEHFIVLYQTESNAVTSLIANLSQHDGNDGVV